MSEAIPQGKLGADCKESIQACLVSGGLLPLEDTKQDATFELPCIRQCLLVLHEARISVQQRQGERSQTLGKL